MEQQLTTCDRHGEFKMRDGTREVAGDVQKEQVHSAMWVDTLRMGSIEV